MSDQSLHTRAGDAGGAGSTVRPTDALPAVCCCGCGAALVPAALGLADRILVAVAGIAPDLSPQVVAVALRQAATKVDPEVSAHDMEPALVLVDAAAAAYAGLSRALLSNMAVVLVDRLRKPLDDLGDALDRAEDELAPYLAARDQRQEAVVPVQSHAEAVAAIAAALDAQDGRVAA